MLHFVVVEIQILYFCGIQWIYKNSQIKSKQLCQNCSCVIYLHNGDTWTIWNNSSKQCPARIKRKI